MAAPSPKAGVKTLGKHKYMAVGIVVVVGAVVYLYFKNRGSTSAGSSSVPANSPATVTSPGDSTGGGASGPDLSGLFDSLFSLLGQDQQTIQTLAGGGGGSSNGGQNPVTNPSPSTPIAPVTSTPTPTDQGISTPTGGGNVTAPVASQPSQPDTSVAVEGPSFSEGPFAGPPLPQMASAPPEPQQGTVDSFPLTPTNFITDASSGGGYAPTPATYPLTETNFATDASNGGGYSPPLVTLSTTKPKPKPAPVSGYSQKSKANLH